MNKLPLLLLFCLGSISEINAQAGKDGAETITTANVIFNRYGVLSATANVGATTITVSDINTLAASAITGTTNNPYASTALAYGDLIMLIKMQGATIATTNNTSYGSITAYNNVGTFELRNVRGVTGNIITLCNGLTNSFVVGGRERVQVIRIPRISTLTIDATGSLTGSSWNGSTGGVVALEVNGNTIVNGSIVASGIGYRGGALDNSSNLPGNTNFLATSPNDGGEKGESIAGYGVDYDGLGGRYNRGAAANGGGGGNAHNSGGGGGANGGAVGSWTGNGNPISGFNSAWELEGAGFSTSTSSGGGRGGYSYGASNLDALTVGPNNSSWGGDNRQNNGGVGGRPLAQSTATLFMGGGGGAGDANNSVGTAGANGGGIIYLLGAGTLSGTGSISANGNAAANTGAGNNDAPGGGGGGGTIRLNVSGAISGIILNALGGNGGSQGAITNESEGPGGGGGGGMVFLTGTPSLTTNITGGNNGTSGSTAVTEFPPNGATRGGAGTITNGVAFQAAPALSCFALPLTLIDFSANLQPNQQVKISWTTTLESEILMYTVEQSADGQQWTAVASQSPANNPGTHSYNIQTSLIANKVYYRLSWKEQSGEVQYSSVRLVTAATAASTAYVNGSQLIVTQVPPIFKEIRIHNSNGQLVKKQRLSHNGTIQLDVSGFSSGVYYLVLQGQGGSARHSFSIR